MGHQMLKKLVLLAALVLLASSPCAAGQSVVLTFVLPGQPPITHPAPWRPGITVEQAMQQAGIKYVTGWFPGLGNVLLIAEGTPWSTNGDLGTPFWWLCVNGRASNVGMTKARIPTAGSSVVWSWTTTTSCTAP